MKKDRIFLNAREQEVAILLIHRASQAIYQRRIKNIAMGWTEMNREETSALDDMESFLKSKSAQILLAKARSRKESPDRNER